MPVAFWTPSITQMIITTQPNGLVAPVHDRMPVILPADADSIWLDPAISKEHALVSAGAVPGHRKMVAYRAERTVEPELVAL